MAKKHLSNNPKHIGPGIWYYEETNGLSLWTNSGWAGHIPTRNIREYLKRKDKKAGE